MNKASGGNGIPAELFQILKDDAVKVLYSMCQQIWKTQQWPKDYKTSVFIPILKKSNAKRMTKLPYNCTHLTHQQVQFISVLSLSHVRLFATPWNATQQASLSITHSRSLLTHVLPITDAIQPSHPLSSTSPPAFNHSQH